MNSEHIDEKPSNKGAEPNTIKDIVKGLVVLIAIVAIVAIALIWIINMAGPGLASIFSTFSSMDAAIVVALITGTISIVTVVAGAIINNALSYKQKKNEYLRKQQEAPYEKLVDIFFDIHVKQKQGSPYTEKELLDLMNEFNKKLTLWGSSKAIKLWGEWRISSTKTPNDPNAVLFGMEKVVLQIRRDLGQKKGLQNGDILRLIVNDIDNYLPNK